MPVWPEKLNDAEYIERIRKAVQTKHRWRYVEGAMAALTLGMTIWLLFIAIGSLADLCSFSRFTKNGHLAPDPQLVYSAFVVAGLFGFLFGFMFYKTVFFIAEMFFGLRQQKLLVECWDALSDAEKSRLRQRSS